MNRHLFLALTSSLALTAAVALTASGCSPAGSPLAKGRTIYKTNSSNTCTSTGVGSIHGGEAPSSPGGSMAGTAVEDGQLVNPEDEESTEAYSVSCSITGTGPYDIKAELAGPNTSPPASDTQATSIRLEGTVGTDGTGSGQVFFHSKPTGSQGPIAGTSCTFKAAPAPLLLCSNSSCVNTEEEPGDFGKMWIEFDCPEMTNGDLGNACAGAGTVIVENCSF